MKMEDMLNSEWALSAAGFLVGALATGMAWGASWLKNSFKKSSNKLDDKLIPIFEGIEEIKNKIK